MMKKIREELASSPALIPPFIERVCAEVGLITGSPDDSFKVKLALEEALSNAMHHGNRLDQQLKVSVFIKIDKNGATIDVHDQGKGFDPGRLPDPTVEPHLSRPSGRGVFLIRSLMDKVEYYDGGRGVRMEKSFAKT